MVCSLGILCVCIDGNQIIIACSGSIINLHEQSFRIESVQRGIFRNTINFVVFCHAEMSLIRAKTQQSYTVRDSNLILNHSDLP